MAAPASEEKQYQGYSYHYSYESAFSESGYSEGSKQAPKPLPAESVTAPAARAATDPGALAAPATDRDATGYEYVYEYEDAQAAPAEEVDHYAQPGSPQYYYGYEDDGSPRAAPVTGPASGGAAVTLPPALAEEGSEYYGSYEYYEDDTSAPAINEEGDNYEYYEDINADPPPAGGAPAAAPAAAEGATARSDAPSNSQYSYETYTPAYSSAPVTDRSGALATGASVGIGAAAAAAAVAGIRATAAAAGRAVAVITLGRDTLLSSPRSADASSLDASSLDASSLGPSSLGPSSMDASSFAHSVPSSIQRTSMDHLPASASAGGAPLRVASALSAGAAASLGAANIPAVSQPAASRRRNPSVAAAWAAGFASRPVPPTDAMDLMQQQRAAALRAEAAGAEAGIATSVPAYSATSVALLAPGALANADALAVLSPAVARSAAEYHKSAATAHTVLVAKQETLRRMQYTVAAMMTQLGQPADEWDTAQKAPSAAEVEQAPKQMQSALRKLLDVAAQNQRQPKTAR